MFEITLDFTIFTIFSVKSIKYYIWIFFLISISEVNLGSNRVILCPNFFIATIHDLADSKLTALSLEVPPKTTRIFFFFSLFISNDFYF